MKRHLIGIGGVGMSALATALVRLGDTVTGSDRNLNTKNISFLESLGVRCFPDDGSGVDAETDEVIVSTAIEDTNPGLVKAKAFGIAVTHRAKALARALEPFRLVAVVGTCGKSTVTAMLGHVLAECGLDPMCVNGANVPGWLGAVRIPSETPVSHSLCSEPRYAVAEVDESDKSLVAFRPYAAIVTNASADHYSKEEMDEVFDTFVKDCPGPVIDARGEVYAPEDFNEQNASLAVRMAVALGCDESRARAAIATFGGVERRLQRILPSSSVNRNLTTPVYDDYAHNPEKLRSMWMAIRKRHGGPLCVVWRPHGYAPLRKMLDDLARMFSEVMSSDDRLLLLPVYDAGGTTDRSINSDALVARVGELGGGRNVILVPSLDAAYDWICANRGGFAAIVTCGARDPELPTLARRIARILV